MTAKEAYELASKQWPTSEQELKAILSDIKYCAERGCVELNKDGLIHKETALALKQMGYYIDYELQDHKTTIRWERPR